MSKERMQRGAHVAGVVLEVPWGHGPPALSPCSGSEVRVLLFNATGDRDTAALLKLLVVRFGGQGWGHCARMPEFPASPGTCFAVGAGSRKVELAVCLSVLLPILLSHLNYPLLGSHSPGCREGTWIIPCPIPCNPAGVGLAPVKSHGWVLRIPTVLIPPVSAALSL